LVADLERTRGDGFELGNRFVDNDGHTVGILVAWLI